MDEDADTGGGDVKWKVLSLGQFFFIKIWGGSDLVSVGELQLLWEDKVKSIWSKRIRKY